MHHDENGNKILYEVVVFFKEQERTFKVPCRIEVIKDVVDLPEPMVLRLAVFGFPVVTIAIRKVLICTVAFHGLISGYISRTVMRVFARKNSSMKLH